MLRISLLVALEPGACSYVNIFFLLEQDYNIVTEFLHGPARIQFDQVQYKPLSLN